MATRKRTTKRKVGATTTRKRRSPVPHKTGSAAAVTGFIVPLIFLAGILFCLGFLLFMGYRTVAASGFFDVKTIEVQGVKRASRDEIDKLVRRRMEKSGVWNADLTEIKNDVEKLSTVKVAAVSRVLPDGVRVNVKERVPVAVIKLDSGRFWADEDGVLFDPVTGNDEAPPFVMTGWDEEKSEKAAKENRRRVEVYKKMLEEWQDFEIAKRVTAVDLSDLRTPQVSVQDPSGATKFVVLPKDNFAEKLKIGLESLAGRGAEVLGINVSDNSPRLIYDKN